MKNSFAPVAFLLLSAAVWGAPAAAQTPDNSAPSETAPEDVREELETGLIASPKQRAEYYVETKNFQRLLPHAQKWSSDYPADPDAWHYLGLARREEGDNAKAAAAFDFAWQLSGKKDFRARENIGDLYAEIKDWAKAEDAYRDAAALRQRRAVLWAKLSEAIILARRPGWEQSAVDALKRTLAFGQYVNKPELWRKYAEILELQKAPAKERYQAYRHVVRLQVKDTATWERLYDIEKERGNDKEADKIVRIISRIDPANAVANMHYGLLALDGGNLKRARSYLDGALSGDSVAPERRSQIYAMLGGLIPSASESLTYYRKAVESNPANIGAWEQAIIRLRNLGKREQAQAAYEQMRKVERKLKRNEELVPEDTGAILE